MQKVLFPMFVGVGMGLAALVHLALGPGLAMQGVLLATVALVGTMFLYFDGDD